MATTQQQREGPAVGRRTDLVGGAQITQNLTVALDRLVTLLERAPERTPVDVRKQVQKAWDEHAPASATLNIDGGTVYADQQWTQLAIEEVVENVAEHAGPGVTVDVTVEDTTIVIADDGPGIAPDHRRRATESGFTTSPTNAGYGLNIVKRVANVHGGTLEIDAADAGGVAVRITFES